MKFGRNRKKRAGAIVVLSAVMMIFIVGMLAFAVDLGYISLVEAEMARTSDAGALAGAWVLLDNAQASGQMDGYYNYYDEYTVYAAVDQYVSANRVANDVADVTWPAQVGDSSGDIQVGYLVDPWDRDAPLDFSDPDLYNAVRVRVRQTADQNGETPMAFAAVLGITSCAQQSEATAVFLNSISGFTTPGSGENLNVMPFAMDKTTWDALMDGTTTDDDWGYDSFTGQVYAGGDGYPEMNLYPHGTESAGNQGTVDIGSDNNSTADISRQILYGITPDDLTYHDGSIELDINGELELNGDTGISAAVKDELASIIGESKIIMIYDNVANPGDNAVYTIVGFAGVRVMEVDLSGAVSENAASNNKVVMIQPAPATSPGGVPSPGGGGTVTSYNVFSPPWIIR